MVWFLWKKEGVITINELDAKSEHTSDTFRFGYILESGEITILFNGDYVALGRPEMKELYPYVEKWVKDNVFTTAIVFAERMM